MAPDTKVPVGRTDTVSVVHLQSKRTNNDVEGWHRRMNSMAGRAQLQFYVLVPLLLREAKLVAIQLQLVREDALTC
ncbi:hypothetical protein DPMN_119437 [Dreissena polymorpha]|uniref:Uncharacterized protein n=1 Tax=Dreissena polymorpha TaxID=45954 RepID=A0A9D4JMQ4_DREPO|nr:hypothetical protein DPMN_119437 [Dreissena polymorpha]